MGLFSWILIGLIAGIVAKLIMPGKEPFGFFMTIIIGIAGGVVGGFIGSILGWGTVSGFDLRSLLLAIGGALLLLWGYKAMKKK